MQQRDTQPTPIPGLQVNLRTILIVAILFWVVPYVGSLLVKFVDDLIVIFIAALLTTSMFPVVSWLSRRGVPRGISILAIYLLLAGVLAFAVLLAVPLLTQETNHLIGQWPRYQIEIDKLLGRFGIHLGQHGTIGIGSQLGSVAAVLPSFVVNLSGLLVNVLVIFVLSFFFTVDEYFAQRLISYVVPPAYRARSNEIVDSIGQRMGRWVLGQLMIVAYYGVTFSAGLAFLHVPYAISVGVVTAILELIPFVGGFVGLALGLLVGVSQSTSLLVPIIVLYLVITNVEAHIIVPNLYGKAIELHPATVVIALLLGAHSFGIIGALIAMPLAAAIQVLFEQLYVEDVIKAAEARQARIPALRLDRPFVLRWPQRRISRTQGPVVKKGPDDDRSPA